MSTEALRMAEILECTDQMHPNADLTSAEVAAELRRLQAQATHEADCAEAYKAETEALKAELAALQEQEPVAWCSPSELDDIRSGIMGVPVRGVPMTGQTIALYTAPVAQPAVSVPQRLTGDGMYGRQQMYCDGWNDCIDAMLEAKP